MYLILTRHGETEENKAGLLQGWTGGTLSGIGKNQAMLLAERLKDAKIDVIFTSDLNRSFNTAKEIYKYHPKTKFVKDKRLRERGLGVLEGKPINTTDIYSAKDDILTSKPKGGESVVEVWSRLKNFYADILKKYADKTVLVVGHGRMMCLLHGIIFGHDARYSLTKIEKLKNTAITEFEIDSSGKYELILFNSESHLVN